MKFTKKPVTIEAVQYDGTLKSLEGFALAYVSQELGSNTVQIPTLEGEMTAQPGDWIIWGVKGEIYPCKPDIFALTYEPASTEHSLSAQDEVLKDDRKSCCGHDSDCAIHNAGCPELLGPCNCSLSAAAPSPAVAVEPVAQMICPSCGKNRFKETCPSTGHCPMIADAQAATPSPSLAVRDGVNEKLEERVRDAVAAALGEAMDCTRTWSAWGSRTMGPHDFSVVAEDDDRLDEIVQAALAAMREKP